MDKYITEALAKEHGIDPEDLEHLKMVFSTSNFVVDHEGNGVIAFNPNVDIRILLGKEALIHSVVRQNAKDQDRELGSLSAARAGSKRMSVEEFCSNEAFLIPEYMKQGEAELEYLIEQGREAENEDASPAGDEPAAQGEVVEPEDQAADEPEAQQVSSESAEPETRSTTLEDVFPNASFAPQSQYAHEPMDTSKGREADNAGAGVPGSAVGSLISSAGSLAAKPIKAGAGALMKGAKSLNAWRQARPGRYLQDLHKAEIKLTDNLKEFRKGPFANFEATVRQRGGWDAELSLKFEEALHADQDFKSNWELVRNQMQEYDALSRKTIQLNRDRAEELEAAMDASAERVGEAGGPVPADMKMGMVTETAEEKSSLLRDFIKRFVARITKRVVKALNSLMGNPSSPTP